jgi:5'-nucleotidase
MRILVTNDDSISAAVLPELVRWAQKLGEVTVVVPKYQQSGKSHGIELHEPYEVVQVDSIHGATTYTVDSTPADCVRFALMGLKLQFDLVISGINRGYNLGNDINYSGTASAACEACAQGIKALSFSTSPAYYDHAVSHMDQIFSYIKEKELLSKNDLYNINIPPQATEVRITRQGGLYYSDDFTPVGNNMYQAVGKCVHKDTGDLTIDSDAVTHGYISITPLTTNKTNIAVFEALK